MAFVLNSGPVRYGPSKYATETGTISIDYSKLFLPGGQVDRWTAEGSTSNSYTDLEKLAEQLAICLGKVYYTEC